ncbi:MAG TPA: Gfo/Idh/MocA family oxidoreductase, partial [Candidatus Nitrosotenuis sp.]|nr:Gfo/Idh/MocA family oxidoreductase [Candidatus Nitrosotenuis sp.]
MTKVAVIGCGYWGKNLVRNFYEIGVLAAISDANETQAQAISRQFNNVPILTFEQIAESQDIQGVVVASPAALHAQHVRYFLEANKHVFVEKPLALDLRHAKELHELAQQKGRILMVGHLLQYHSAYLKLKEMVAQNVLGKLRYVYSNRLSTGKIRQEENVWWSFAPHDISMILGLVQEPLVQVQASASTFVTT